MTLSLFREQPMDHYEFKRILLTGARGLLGRALYPLVRETFPFATIVPVSRTPARHSWDPEGPCLDLSDPEAWLRLPGPFDLVFHLASAIPPKGRPQGFDTIFQPNVSMAANLVESAKQWNTAKIVNASSISVYSLEGRHILSEKDIPHPRTVYGISKLACEHYCDLALSHGASVVNLRLSSLYGPYQQPWHKRTVLNIFLEQVLNGKSPVIFGTGNRCQDFIYSADAATAFLKASTAAINGTFNIGSGRSTSMNELAETMVKVYGSPHLAPVKYHQELEEPSVHLDISQAAAILGFVPKVSIEAGIRRLVDSFSS